MKSGLNIQGYGLPFFSEDEWNAARVGMEDGHTFHDTYAEFLARIEQGERDLRGKGYATVRVHIRMDEFLPWCKANGRKVDAQSRSTYAALKVAQQDGHGRRPGQPGTP